MHLPSPPNIFSYPSFTPYPASEHGPCFLCNPLSNTILLTQAFLVVFLAFLAFLLSMNQHKAFYKLSQFFMALWVLNLATLMGHATWKYFTDPWATPWTQEKPDGMRQGGVRLLGVGFNIVFQVVMLWGYAVGLWVLKSTKRWLKKESRVGGAGRATERREEKK